MFRIALGLIALRVVDVNVLQPAAGTSAADHLAGGLVPLTLLGVAAAAHGRLSAGPRALLTLATGVAGITVGLDAAYYVREVGISAGDVSGLLAIAAGMSLIGLGARDLWRSRRGDRWRYPRRAAIAVAAFFGVQILVVPAGMGYVSTKVARADVPAANLGAAYEDVRFTTRDGLELEGWYIPSRNGAAVISFPGRNGPQRQARMLARHGYGVLVFDRRGEGRSEGEPNAFGWGGAEDVKAAVRYLRSRPDVDDDRVGGIGLSVGGELMLEAAAGMPDLRAVVSEGAGARSHREELDAVGVGTLDKVLGGIGYALKDVTMTIAANRTPPPHLKDLVGRIAPRPILLIAAPNSPNGERLNRLYHGKARGPKELWEIPESRHIGGIEARPEEYERRVVGFFDRSL
jgi:hypothetical protein